MGRKPLPTEIKRLKGTLRPCRTNPREPKPQGEVGAPPAYMTERAKEFWYSVLEISPPGVITACDFAVLESFCNALAMREVAQEKVSKYGITGSGKVSAELRALALIEGLVARSGSELGLSPAARQKVGQGYGDPTNPDGFTMDMFEAFDDDDGEVANA